MPKNEIDYSNTIIYKICCNDLNISDIYVGHTTNFIQRKYGHKKVCNNIKDKDYNLKVYKTIRENGGWDNWCMVEIEKINCNSRNEASARERFWYEQLNSKLNSMVPNQTLKEWKKIKNTCECGSTFTNPNKLQHLKTIVHKKYLESLNPL